MLLQSSAFPDYELLDSGEKERLERFGTYTLIRPDPQAIWKKQLPQSKWGEADAIFEKTQGTHGGQSADSGRWQFRDKPISSWNIKYNELTISLKLTPFKHTGIFPEQAAQWEWISSVIARSGATKQSRNKIATPAYGEARNDKKLHILNLFGYTGIASLVAAAAGAKVTHVDASRPTITWAKENQVLSGLSDKPIRWIFDDALKFATREIRRGVRYDGIIMDPPIYGHGPKGELWKFQDDFPILMDICKKILSNNPLFIIINAYAISASSLMLENVLADFVPNQANNIESGELVLKEKDTSRMLSTGIFARWSSSE